jgi:hypothetical protein
MTAYEAAIEAHNAALTTFAAIRADYFAGKVSDADFLAARAVKVAADAAFDVAFEVAANEPEAVAAEVADDQGELFAAA